MTAPTIFFMFLNAFAPIVLSDNYITTIVFNEPVIRPHTGASKHEIFMKLSPDSKMIFLQSKGKDITTNLNVNTQSGKFYSFLIKKGDRPHSIISIKDGKKSSLYRNIKSNHEYEIEQSDFSYRVRNNSNYKITVNSMLVDKDGVLETPKGAPIFINQKRVFK